MKRLIVLLAMLSSMIGLYAQVQEFLGLRSNQITAEVAERIKKQNRLARGPSFNFTSSPYNLPDAVDIRDPATGRFKEDIPWTKDFSRHVDSPSSAGLYLYHNNPEHFIITQPDPNNPLKLRFQPIPEHWNGSELIVLTVSDEPLGRSDKAYTTAIIKVSVEPVSDPPIFSGLPIGNRFHVKENETLSVNFDDYVTCIDAAPLEFDLFVTQTQFAMPYPVEVEQLNPKTKKPEAHGHLLKFTPMQPWPQAGVDGTVRFVITAVDRKSNTYAELKIYVAVVTEKESFAVTTGRPGRTAGVGDLFGVGRFDPTAVERAPVAVTRPLDIVAATRGGTGCGTGTGGGVVGTAIVSYQQSDFSSASDVGGLCGGTTTRPAGRVDVRGKLPRAEIAALGKPVAVTSGERAAISRISQRAPAITEGNIAAAPQEYQSDMEALRRAVNSRKSQLTGLYRKTPAIQSSGGSVNIRIYGTGSRIEAVEVIPTSGNLPTSFLKEIKQAVSSWSVSGVSGEFNYTFSIRFG